jgi:glycosyltransferase involved in cell wall biosynthesis
MHILFLSHYFPPEVNAPAARTYEHCRRWAAAGHKVTVVTCAPNCPDGVVYKGYKNRLLRRETVDGIAVVRVWTFVAPNRGVFRRAASYLSYLASAVPAGALVRGVDIVVATSPQFFCGVAGALVSRLRRRPFVLEVRDLWPESIVAVGAMKKSPAVRLLERLEKRMYRAADRIVTVGPGYRDGICARGADPSKVAVVTNGIDLPSFRPRTDVGAVIREFNAEGKFVCTYAGTVGMAHGLEVVLEAAGRCKKNNVTDVAFWIVGSGAAREKLQKEARAQGLDNVVFTGRQPRERMPEIIAASGACLVHLRSTVLFGSVIPSKLFEIMALDVPVIMGVRGRALELVLEAGAGVAMEPESAESLVRCMETIRAQGRGAFAGGREYVSRHFDRNVLAMRMLSILKETRAAR